MADADDRQAGTIILRDLALFNRAAVLFETRIAPLARQAVGDAVREWAGRHRWKGGGYDEEDYEELWVAPPKWHLGEDEWLAWFSLDRPGGKESDSYALADLAGVGESDFGLRFLVEHSYFGGRRSWNAYVSTLTAGIGTRLSARGWLHEGKGAFFRKLTLPADRLAEAWENEDWDLVLEPFEQALDAAMADVSSFQEIIDGAKALRG